MELIEGLVMGVADRVFEAATEVPDPTEFVAVTAKE
jgi:hypothetical protein